MDTKNYYILIIVIAVIAGVTAFHFYKPNASAPLQSSKLNDQTLQSLTNQAAKSQENKSGAGPKVHPDSNQAFNAYAKVNRDLAQDLKVVSSALSSGEKAFVAMNQIYENPDYNLFFATSDATLKTQAFQSRSQAEDSFLYGRSGLMAAEDDAKANIDTSLTKTETFLNDMIAALNYTKAALAKSSLTASITQVQIDSFNNSISGALNDILNAKSALVNSRDELNKDRSDPAYLYYLQNIKEYKIVQ